MAGSTSGKTTVRRMTEGSIVKQVICFALPLMLGNVFQMLYNTVDSIVVGNFVGIRQVYLFAVTRLIANTPRLVGFGYPVGWTTCCIIEVAYFLLRWGKNDGLRSEGT